MAGAITSERGIVPHRSSASDKPASVPGTPTEIPLVDAAVNPRVPNMSAVAAAGACSRESTMNVSPVRARWIIMKPPPPMPEDWGSTTLRASWIATAASMAFPPASSMRAPASAASGCETATTPAWVPRPGGTPGVGAARSARAMVESERSARTTSARRLRVTVKGMSGLLVRGRTASTAPERTVERPRVGRPRGAGPMGRPVRNGDGRPGGAAVGSRCASCGNPPARGWARSPLVVLGRVERGSGGPGVASTGWRLPLGLAPDGARPRC
jgi:hypothetical protein